MLANLGNLRVVQSARIKMAGNVVPIHQVTYTIGQQGPFTDSFEDSQFTPEAVLNSQASRMVKLARIGVSLPVPITPVPGNPNVYNIPTFPTPASGDIAGVNQQSDGTFTYTLPS